MLKRNWKIRANRQLWLGDCKTCPIRMKRIYLFATKNDILSITDEVEGKGSVKYLLAHHNLHPKYGSVVPVYQTAHNIPELGIAHRLIHISPHPLKINDLLEPACERRTAIIQRSTTRSALFQGVPGGCAQK
ncbi:hypothetical protein B7R78_0000555 [Ralstonia solanacearum]|uniref:hypothetical protein n=1 Tax=Ralstonia solanacearum TaxID=305 RepID=UPI0015E8E4E0|nr:hypothetical protein [Ralstonia solanacearum]MBT1535684.1 hypothetical protein [Ralstonia solanacearum]